MPFTIPEIHVGSVVSGDAFLENVQIAPAGYHIMPDGNLMSDREPHLPEPRHTENLTAGYFSEPRHTTLALGEESPAPMQAQDELDAYYKNAMAITGLPYGQLLGGMRPPNYGVR